MPIYEYVCKDCNETFEKLVGREEEVVCPVCKGPRVSKQYSRFGMGSGSPSRPYESLPVYKGGGCCCTPGSCGCKN